jgi:hypothetical protein
VLASASSSWFVSEQGKLSGPFSAERIRVLLEWGKISADAYVCDEFSSAWIPIRQSRFGAHVKGAPPATGLPIEWRRVGAVVLCCAASVLWLAFLTTSG